MPHAKHRRFRAGLVGALLLGALLFGSGIRRALAQEADPRPITADTTVRAPNTTAGEFTPAAGFQLFESSKGSLNISMYGLFRYVDQAQAHGGLVDHLGRPQIFNYQNSLNWHRSMIWMTGFLFDPKLRYNITSWSLATTQQALIFGNLQYLASKYFIVGIGILPNLTARSMQGSWPFWAGTDRLMAEEYFRGGFSSGMFATGEVVPRLTYALSMNNNLSQLGVTQANDSRELAYSASLRWQPTTGEFGPRGGFNDLEYHKHFATQFGASAGTARESRGSLPGTPPAATQIKISDGLNAFDDDALGPGVTLLKLTYREAAIDAGAKYRGFSFQSEYYFRTLNDFEATAPPPTSSIYDHGFMAEASYMVGHRTLALYGVGGAVFDQFRRRPWEAGGGLDYYPTGTRSWRLNLHLLHVDKCPASSFFGYYLAGLTGTIFSLGTDILL